MLASSTSVKSFLELLHHRLKDGFESATDWDEFLSMGVSAVVAVTPESEKISRIELISELMDTLQQIGVPMAETSIMYALIDGDIKRPNYQHLATLNRELRSLRDQNTLTRSLYVIALAALTVPFGEDTVLSPPVFMEALRHNRYYQEPILSISIFVNVPIKLEKVIDELSCEFEPVELFKLVHRTLMDALLLVTDWEDNDLEVHRLRDVALSRNNNL